MVIELPSLPYDRAALEPHISGNTLGFHHGKHHNAYVTNLNNMIADTELAGGSLEDIIKHTAGDASKVGVFNNSAQVWNHTFLWNSMAPGGGGAPSGDLAAGIDKAFGSLDEFKDKFKAAGVGRFGSGWVWLVADSGGALEIVTTPNAETPLTTGKTALLTCDVSYGRIWCLNI